MPAPWEVRHVDQLELAEERAAKLVGMGIGDEFRHVTPALRGVLTVILDEMDRLRREVDRLKDAGKASDPVNAPGTTVLDGYGR
jgi:hypothetical protein